jgi:hypothetical protein
MQLSFLPICFGHVKALSFAIVPPDFPGNRLTGIVIPQDSAYDGKRHGAQGR